MRDWTQSIYMPSDAEQTERQITMRKNRFLAIINLAVLVILTGMVFVYRTSWGQEQLFGPILIGVAILSLISTVTLTILYFIAGRHDQALWAIASNLTDLTKAKNAEDVREKISAVGVDANTSETGRGWNQLLAIIDQMDSEVQTTRAENNMGQFLCSYDSQRLLGVIDYLPDGLILADSSGTIILANRSCEGKIGCGLSEIINRSILDLFEDDHAQEHLKGLLDNKSEQGENYFEAKVGEEPDQTVLRIDCLRLADPRKNGEILLIIRDITQQKISESSLNDFITHVSHELRSPLTNIRAYSETLLSDMVLDASAQKEAFNVINNETIRLTNLINDVLDLSHMETGTLSLDCGEVVLDRLVRQCVNDNKGMTVGKKISLHTNYHPKLPNLNADREKLVVVINNVLSNAIKYTPQGGNVFIETNVDENNVYIKISDTGYGIAPEDIDKIFEKFYRVDRAETADIAGSGLGLATSKEIVVLHGGSIKVTSELNNGTEMLITLPLTVTGPVLGPNNNQ